MFIVACLISDLKRGVHDGDEACLDPLLKLNKTRKNAEKVVSAVREKLSKFAEALLDFSGRLTQGLRLESASSSTFLSLLESIRDWYVPFVESFLLCHDNVIVTSLFSFFFYALDIEYV